jgi:hypothetical protein
MLYEVHQDYDINILNPKKGFPEAERIHHKKLKITIILYYYREVTKKEFLYPPLFPAVLPTERKALVSQRCQPLKIGSILPLHYISTATSLKELGV